MTKNSNASTLEALLAQNAGGERTNRYGRRAPVLSGCEVVVTGTPCSLCSSEGQRTNGGEIPALRHLKDDARLFCLIHGWANQ